MLQMVFRQVQINIIFKEIKSENGFIYFEYDGVEYTLKRIVALTSKQIVRVTIVSILIKTLSLIHLSFIHTKKWAKESSLLNMMN